MPRKLSPRADGFGKYTRGGEDGEILFINSLTDAASRTPWQKSNARIIIPRIAGYVELASNLNVSYNGRSNFTYLGILAPKGSELVYKNYEVRISSVKNFIIRGLKSRLGDRNKEISTSSGDAFTCAKFSAEPEGCVNFYIDHSVGSWGTDELFSISSGEQATVQYCMFYEPLHQATVNEKGTPHGFGHIFGSKNLSFHHNIHAFIHERVPQFQNGSSIPDELNDVRNNAFYAWNFKPADLAGTVRKINFIKNSWWRKINYTGGGVGGAAGLGAICQFRGDTSENSSRAYLFGNKLKKFEGGVWVDVHNALGDDAESQRVFLYGTNGTNTTNLRNIVGVLTPFEVPAGTYDFDETTEQSDAKILSMAGTLNQDPVDQRIKHDWQNGLVPITGSVTGIAGMIDAPEDSKHFGSANTGYPTILAGTQILDGPSPHFLPSWFTTKYSLSTVYDYTLAGTPLTRPERFIIFKLGAGTQLSQYVGTIDYDNDLIYNVYSVLSFHETGEIEQLEDVPVIIEFDLTLSVHNPANGSVIRVPENNPIEEGNSVTLTATPNSGFTVQWRLNDSTGEILNTSNVYVFNMVGNITIVAVFVAVPAPPSSFNLTLSVNNGALGSATRTPDSNPILEGNEVRLSAIPMTGYRVQWIDAITENILSINSTYIFNMPNENLSITAVFIQKRTQQQGKKLKIKLIPN